MNRILSVDPKLDIPDARKIVGIRNKIIHGYDDIDDVIVYTVATKYLAQLKRDIESLQMTRFFSPVGRSDDVRLMSINPIEDYCRGIVGYYPERSFY